MRRFLLAVAVIAATAAAGCGGASALDDAARGAVKGGDEAPFPGGSGPDLPPLGTGDELSSITGLTDDLSRAEAESAEARGVLETMIEGEERTWVCLGLDLVESSSDGDVTIADYATVMAEHGFGDVPTYRARQAFDASVQLLAGDLSQLQELGCL